MSRPSLSSYVAVQPNSSSSTSKPLTYTSQSLWVPCGARGVFGGQVIAQCLSAAAGTVSSPLGLHSQHCYFLLPALSSPAITYQVEKLRDGRSYATRAVRAIQKDRVVFVLIASYTLPPQHLPELKIDSSTPFSFTPMVSSTSRSPSKEKSNPSSLSLRFAIEQPERSVSTGTGIDGEHVISGKKDVRSSSSWRAQENAVIPPFSPRFGISFPEGLLPYQECEVEEHRWKRFLDTAGKDLPEKRKAAIQEYINEREESPVEICVARRTLETSSEVDPHKRMVWARAKLGSGEIPSEEVMKIMIAYMTDFQFIGTAARSVGLTWTSKPRLGMLASLDHTTHYYPFPEGWDPKEPLLHVMESIIADVPSGRGMVRGLVYTAGGVLVAVTSQEGVVRADPKGTEVNRGLQEGGEVGDTGDPIKAKL